MHAPVRLPKLALLLGTTAVALAACGGTEGGSGEVTPNADTTLTVVAGDMFFDPEELTADAGTIAIQLDNEGAVVHNLVIEQTETKVVEATGGNTATGTIDLVAGSYVFYCDIPGHRTAGMEGSIDIA